MKHTKEEIINALKVIKEECLDSHLCSDCPFWDQDSALGCRIQDAVETWEISDPEPEIWRALK